MVRKIVAAVVAVDPESANEIGSNDGEDKVEERARVGKHIFRARDVAVFGSCVGVGTHFLGWMSSRR